MGYHSEGGID